MMQPPDLFRNKPVYSIESWYDPGFDKRDWRSSVETKN